MPFYAITLQRITMILIHLYPRDLHARLIMDDNIKNLTLIFAVMNNKKI